MPDDGIIDGEFEERPDETRALAVPEQRAPVKVEPKKLMPVDPEAPIWSRCVGEPMRWFLRFEQYRQIEGGRRTVLAVYRMDWLVRNGADENRKRPTKVPASWWRMVALWGWKQRAAAFDDHIHDIQMDAENEKRKQARERRLAETERLRSRAMEAIDSIPPEEISAGVATRMLKLAHESERIDLGQDRAAAGDEGTVRVKVLRNVDLSKLD